MLSSAVSDVNTGAFRSTAVIQADLVKAVTVFGARLGASAFVTYSVSKAVDVLCAAFGFVALSVEAGLAPGAVLVNDAIGDLDAATGLARETFPTSLRSVAGCFALTTLANALESTICIR